MLFKDANFKATHNSYSGNIRGNRGSYIQQLDAGIRFLELDIYSRDGKFIIGHNSPGDEVDHGRGNPASNDMNDWLNIVVEWSDQNPNHYPITVGLDIKENITNLPSGNLTTLNDEIQRILATRLFPANTFNAEGTTVSELRGLILVVLSGDEATRIAYHNLSSNKQIMFVEYQKGNSGLLQEVIFYAASASGNEDWAQEQRGQGKIVRLWGFDSDNDTRVAVNFPATDDPYDSWYIDYSESIGTLPQFSFETVRWGDSKEYDSGKTPSVAIDNNNVAVEVHKSEDNDTLWYHVGQVNTTNRSITWGESHQYDKGESPSVSMNNSNVAVEVHKSEDHDTLWCHVGQVNTTNQSIIWGESHQYDKGEAPLVAINNGNVAVEVHKSEDHDILWYHVGRVNITTKTIDWGESVKYDTGVTPSVAINDAGVVIEAHKSENHDTLWCRVGQVNMMTRTIDWQDNYQYQYDRGKSPAVGINANYALEVHKSQNNDTLWYHVGFVSGTIMVWNGSARYDDGVDPSVALNDAGVAVEVHKSENNNDTLWYHVGT